MEEVESFHVQQVTQQSALRCRDATRPSLRFPGCSFLGFGLFGVWATCGRLAGHAIGDWHFRLVHNYLVLFFPFRTRVDEVLSHVMGNVLAALVLFRHLGKFFEHRLTLQFREQPCISGDQFICIFFLNASCEKQALLRTVLQSQPHSEESQLWLSRSEPAILG